MQQVVLLPIPLEELLSKVTNIVTAAIADKDKKDFQEKLLSATEACKIFNPVISKVTLHRWTKDGLIPTHRVGGRIYYKHSEVIEAAKAVKKYDRNKTAAA